MLTSFPNGIGWVYNREERDQDGSLLFLQDTLSVQHSDNPEEEALSDDYNGSAHALEERYLYRPLKGHFIQLLQILLKFLYEIGTPPERFHRSDITDRIRNQRPYQFLRTLRFRGHPLENRHVYRCGSHEKGSERKGN